MNILQDAILMADGIGTLFALFIVFMICKQLLGDWIKDSVYDVLDSRL